MGRKRNAAGVWPFRMYEGDGKHTKHQLDMAYVDRLVGRMLNMTRVRLSTALGTQSILDQRFQPDRITHPQMRFKQALKEAVEEGMKLVLGDELMDDVDLNIGTLLDMNRETIFESSFVLEVLSYAEEDNGRVLGRYFVKASPMQGEQLTQLAFRSVENDAFAKGEFDFGMHHLTTRADVGHMLIHPLKHGTFDELYRQYNVKDSMLEDPAFAEMVRAISESLISQIQTPKEANE